MKLQPLPLSAWVSCRTRCVIGPKVQSTIQAAVAKRAWRVREEMARTMRVAGTMPQSEQATIVSAAGAVCTTVSREGEKRMDRR